MPFFTKITSAGVPTNAPTTPAAIPSTAFVAKPGGFPSGLEIKNNTDELNYNIFQGHSPTNPLMVSNSHV